MVEWFSEFVKLWTNVIKFCSHSLVNRTVFRSENPLVSVKI